MNNCLCSMDLALVLEFWLVSRLALKFVFLVAVRVVTCSSLSSGLVFVVEFVFVVVGLGWVGLGCVKFLHPHIFLWLSSGGSYIKKNDYEVLGWPPAWAVGGHPPGDL